MQGDKLQNSRVRRVVNDLILAEMFLVQATIESADAVASGVTELGRQVAGTGGKASSTLDAVARVLRRTADGAVEPYRSRFNYLRDLVTSGD